MIDETLQFQLTQYLDGDLPVEQRVELERRLAEDAELRAELERYRSLDRLITDAAPLPEMDWDRLTDRFSQAVNRQHLRSTWWAYTNRRLAMAAAVLLVVGITASVYVAHRSVTQSTSVAEVRVLNASTITQPATVQIEIGPGAGVGNGDSWNTPGGVGQQSSLVVIESAPPRVQDSDLSLF